MMTRGILASFEVSDRFNNGAVQRSAPEAIQLRRVSAIQVLEDSERQDAAEAWTRQNWKRRTPKAKQRFVGRVPCLGPQSYNTARHSTAFSRTEPARSENDEAAVASELYLLQAPRPLETPIAT